MMAYSKTRSGRFSHDDTRTDDERGTLQLNMMKGEPEKMRKRMSVMLVLGLLVCSMILSTASAGTSIGGGDPADRLRQVPEFKFYHCEYGIGRGVCPVYTAPSADAFRVNGNAKIATDYEMYEGGYDAGWLMVRYETNNGGVRVGYIPPSYADGYKSFWGTRSFEYVPVTAEQTIMVTDNPMLRGSGFALLSPGESFHILAKYTYHGDWWYIQCTVDGQVARGFIDRESSAFSLGDGSDSAQAGNTPVTLSNLGNPSVSPLGTEQIGEVTVNYGNGRQTVRKDADPNSAEVAYLDPGTKYPCYGSKTGTTGKLWYYIWIEEVSRWGWISSGSATFIH